VPTYAYACTACEHRFEIVQSFSDDSLTECPECGCRLRKLFNAVGVVFKGAGFYRNDSRNDSRNGKRSGTGSRGRKGSTSSPAPSGDSGSSSSSTTSSSSDSSGSTGTTKTATKSAPKSSSRSEGSAA
jgi:putative FmdB family regulatory protein